MFNVIARESRTVREYARRAEAFNSSEAEPLTDAQLAGHYLAAHDAPVRGPARELVVKAIRKARRERVSKREAMWGALVAGVSLEVES